MKADLAILAESPLRVLYATPTSGRTIRATELSHDLAGVTELFLYLRSQQTERAASR